MLCLEESPMVLTALIASNQNQHEHVSSSDVTGFQCFPVFIQIKEHWRCDALSRQAINAEHNTASKNSTVPYIHVTFNRNFAVKIRSVLTTQHTHVTLNRYSCLSFSVNSPLSLPHTHQSYLDTSPTRILCVYLSYPLLLLLHSHVTLCRRI